MNFVLSLQSTRTTKLKACYQMSKIFSVGNHLKEDKNAKLCVVVTNTQVTIGTVHHKSACIRLGEKTGETREIDSQRHTARG